MFVVKPDHFALSKSKALLPEVEGWLMEIPHCVDVGSPWGTAAP